ncbi:MAG: alpha/beta hydrolase [Mycobacteriales bacterium]
MSTAANDKRNFSIDKRYVLDGGLSRRQDWSSQQTTEVTMTTIEKHTAVRLHREVRGQGPAVLLIAGTPGDGGQFDALAQELAGSHTVITYDRRGTSRSPEPQEWTVTSVAEHAEDAAALVADETAGPALVYGTSNGAAVALELAVRHPEQVSAVILHEMPLLTVVADPQPVADAMGAVIGAAMEQGGPVAALEAFLRMAFGDPVVDGWNPALRHRLLANASMAFGIELPAFQSYRPDESQLAEVTVPVHVLVGRDQAQPFFLEAADWLAQRLQTVITRSPGGHGAHFTCPRELAATIGAIGMQR